MLSKTRSDLILRPYTPGWRPHDARRRAGGASAALAVHMIALTALLWGGLRAVPLPSSASDRVVTSFAVPQAVPSPARSRFPRPAPARQPGEPGGGGNARPHGTAARDICGHGRHPRACALLRHTGHRRQQRQPTGRAHHRSPVVVAPPAPHPPRVRTSRRRHRPPKPTGRRACWVICANIAAIPAPPSAAQQGIATLAITLDRQGRVLEVALRHGSGYALLDAEALATARRASPCPRPMRRCPATRCGSRCPSTFPCAGGG
jgi:protein TonB